MARESATETANVRVVLDGYEHFNRGDIEWMCERMTPEIVWDDSKNIPGRRTYKGIDQVRAYLGSFQRVWVKARFDPEDVRGRGDHVLVFVRFVARGRQSGAEVDASLAHLYEMREGKGHRVMTYLDRGQAERDFDEATLPSARNPA